MYSKRNWEVQTCCNTRIKQENCLKRVDPDQDFLKRYSVEKMILELYKLRRVFLQDGLGITLEITKRQYEILESLSITQEHGPTVPKSQGYKDPAFRKDE